MSAFHGGEPSNPCFLLKNATFSGQHRSTGLKCNVLQQFSYQYIAYFATSRYRIAICAMQRSVAHVARAAHVP
jgi:hypothetical protein